MLSAASEDGHCYLPQLELGDRVVKRLALPEHQPNAEQVAALVTQMGADGDLVLQRQEGNILCYAPAFYQAETHLAERLNRLRGQPLAVDLPRVQRWIGHFVAQTGLTLSEQQRQAVERAAQQRVLILTGGPGCGKTFTTRTIVAL